MSSRVLPNAAVERAFSILGVENQTILADGAAELAKVLPAMMELGLQKIYGYHHNDGDWGWILPKYWPIVFKPEMRKRMPGIH